MAAYVRGNVAVVKATFRASDGTTTQPDDVNAYFNYTNRSNVNTTTTVAAAYDAEDKVWTALFDTTPVKANTQVKWTVEGTSPLQGASEGAFFVKANAANP
jgi:hypothetical protein